MHAEVILVHAYVRACVRAYVCGRCLLHKICEIATIVKSCKTILNYIIHKARPCSIIEVVIYNIHIQLLYNKTERTMQYIVYKHTQNVTTVQ